MPRPITNESSFEWCGQLRRAALPLALWQVHWRCGSWTCCAFGVKTAITNISLVLVFIAFVCNSARPSCHSQTDLIMHMSSPAAAGVEGWLLLKAQICCGRSYLQVNWVSVQVKVHPEGLVTLHYSLYSMQSFVYQFTFVVWITLSTASHVSSTT